MITKHASKLQGGLYIDFSDPDPDSIRIEDIARALSRECRFANHTPVHYSVAEHCVLATQLANNGYRAMRVILLHDASEAYTRDIPAPLKSLLPEFSAVEDRLMSVIYEKWGLLEDYKELQCEVKRVDQMMYEIEDSVFFGGDNLSSCELLKMWSPERAEMEFMRVARYCGIAS
jgi:uncharacterized protein